MEEVEKYIGGVPTKPTKVSGMLCTRCMRASKIKILRARSSLYPYAKTRQLSSGTHH